MRTDCHADVSARDAQPRSAPSARHRFRTPHASSSGQRLSMLTVPDSLQRFHAETTGTITPSVRERIPFRSNPATRRKPRSIVTDRQKRRGRYWYFDRYSESVHCICYTGSNRSNRHSRTCCSTHSPEKPSNTNNRHSRKSLRRLPPPWPVCGDTAACTLTSAAGTAGESADRQLRPCVRGD